MFAGLTAQANMNKPSKTGSEPAKQDQSQQNTDKASKPSRRKARNKRRPTRPTLEACSQAGRWPAQPSGGRVPELRRTLVVSTRTAPSSRSGSTSFVVRVAGTSTSDTFFHLLPVAVRPNQLRRGREQASLHWAPRRSAPPHRPAGAALRGVRTYRENHGWTSEQNGPTRRHTPASTAKPSRDATARPAPPRGGRCRP